MAAYIERGDVKFTYKHRTVLGADSAIAAEAAECAGEQGKFWEFHDKLFASQGRKFTRSDYVAMAGAVGLDGQSFGACLDSGKYRDRVRQQDKEGQARGVDATPTFFINGTKVRGVPPVEEFLKVVDTELKK